MKKPAIGILVLITCVFTAFIVGFFAGRNLNRTPVQIWQATAAPTQPASEETAATDPIPTEPVIVNINAATAEQLQTLPGIGPVLSGRIIAWREENGAFQSPEELTKVKGIGEATLLEILDLITVGG